MKSTVRSIFFAPHSDDEALFGAFLLQKYQPTVVICFPSSGDYGSTEERFKESLDACLHFGVTDVRQWRPENMVDLASEMVLIKHELHPDIVWAPNIIASHDDHVAVCKVADHVFKASVRHYETYSAGSKDRILPEVPIEDPRWIQEKLRALSKYHSQIAHPRARQFFLMDLYEYAEQP